jgi:hypothetical protein
MRRCRALVLLPILAAACSGRADTDAAAHTFASFQAALQRGDQTACRALLTRESQQALAELPWDRVRRQQPLVVLDTERSAGEYLVHVRDPNDGGRRSEFVVVREYGQLVVDLVATAGRHAEVVEAAGSAEELVPRELTPADYDRIRQHELAQPPR